MKIRFLTSIADVRGWAYDFNEIAEVTDAAAELFIATGKAVAVVERTCPHCGATLEVEGPEAAALVPRGERAVLPGGRKRG